jgi:hypothetical protein
LPIVRVLSTDSLVQDSGNAANCQAPNAPVFKTQNASIENISSPGNVQSIKRSSHTHVQFKLQKNIFDFGPKLSEIGQFFVLLQFSAFF